MKPIFTYTNGMLPVSTHYCPGCTHGIAHRLIMEVLEENGKLGQAIGVAPIGCSVMAHQYMNVDMCEAAHGRAPAVATGIRRVHPDKVVFTYQGDGDLASIGMSEIIAAAARGERFSTFFINNGIYGMTGGQLAPTTLIGQRATTAPMGRTEELHGKPMRVAELLSTLDGLVYAERVCVADIPNILKAKKAIKKAFTKQMNNEGFTFVEVLCACPTNWGMTPQEALKWLADNMIPQYPLGVKKEVQ